MEGSEKASLPTRIQRGPQGISSDLILLPIAGDTHPGCFCQRVRNSIKIKELLAKECARISNQKT